MTRVSRIAFLLLHPYVNLHVVLDCSCDCVVNLCIVLDCSCNCDVNLPLALDCSCNFNMNLPLAVNYLSKCDVSSCVGFFV